MDIISYIKCSNFPLFNKQILKDFCRFNNASYISKINSFYENSSNESIKYEVYRIFDIMDKIIIIIKKKGNEFIDIDDILNISLIIDNYTKFTIIVEKHNIIYDCDKLAIINLNLSNFVKYQDENIGGLPLFLFDTNHTKILIHLKKKIKFDYWKLLDLHVGGFMIIPQFIKHRSSCLKMIKLVPKLSLNNKQEIMKKLTFNDPNDKTDYEMKKYSNSKILNYLNLVLYNKSIFENYIIYNLELEQETSHLILSINYEIIYKIRLTICLDDCDIFASNIYSLYSDGYFIFKFNSQIKSDSKITLHIFKSFICELNANIHDIDEKMKIQIFNVYDLSIII